MSQENKEKKIDLFKYGEVQDFNEPSDDEIEKQLKQFENKINDDKFIDKLKKKGLDLKSISSVLEQYAKIKKNGKISTNKPNKNKLNTKVRNEKLNRVNKKKFENKINNTKKQSNKKEELDDTDTESNDIKSFDNIIVDESLKSGNKNNSKSKQNKNSRPSLSRKFKPPLVINFNDKSKLDSKEKMQLAQNTKFKTNPRNLVITKPNVKIQSCEGDNPQKKNSNQNNQNPRYNNSIKSNPDLMPLKECNKNWDYTLHGDDWMCMCQVGSHQSPINIISHSAEKKNLQKLKNLKLRNKINKNKESSSSPIDNFNILKKFPDNIFFDFKDPELSCQSETEEIPCKYPVIKNTGSDLTIEDDCGVLVMPPHLNGYKCFKIELHTPAEHKIDNKQFELEIQIYFKLEDKRIVDENTMDLICLVLLFKGIDEDNVSKIGLADGPILNHPFLDLLDMDKLPYKKGHARMLTKYFNFNLLLDPSVQPMKLKSKKEENNLSESNQEMEKFLDKCENCKSKDNVIQAINDLTYDKNHPLNEFYFYTGSLNKPPCDENVLYIISPNILYAPMEQIIVSEIRKYYFIF
jgi:carbonic anhydrase